MNLKNKTLLFHDEGGICLPFAIRLARDYGRVLYFNEWESAFSVSKDNRIGEGFDDIEKVDDFDECVDDADIIVFPFCTRAAKQVRLENQGKRVWGSRYGSEIELDRMMANKLFTKLDIPSPTMVKIKGVDKLKQHLKENDDKYIKISRFRGNRETFHHETYELSESVLDDFAHELGGEKDLFEFIVCDPIDSDCEVGYDGFCIDGQFPSTTLFGYECKDACYAGHVRKMDNMSPLVTDAPKKLAPYLKKEGYRNFFHLEHRIDKKKTPFLTDVTCRQAIPPGELYIEMCSNISEIVWFGSDGELKEPEWEAKYGVQVIIKSSWAGEDKWQGVSFPDSIKRWVKLHFAMKAGDTYHIIPRYDLMNEIGCVVAIGDTLDEAIEKAEKYCKQIKGYSVECCIGDVKKIRETIKKGDAIGISF